MPTLQAAPTCYPEDLFSWTDRRSKGAVGERKWWLLHTRPRQEKRLAGELFEARIPHYLPVITERRTLRSKLTHAYLPLFPGYLFLLSDHAERSKALSTKRVAKTIPIPDQAEVARDLTGIYRLLATGLPAQVENNLASGDEVIINAGPMTGMSGKIMRDATGKRFVVAVNFIQQGASVLMDGASLKPIRTAPTP